MRHNMPKAETLIVTGYCKFYKRIEEKNGIVFVANHKDRYIVASDKNIVNASLLKPKESACHGNANQRCEYLHHLYPMTQANRRLGVPVGSSDLLLLGNIIGFDGAS